MCRPCHVLHISPLWNNLLFQEFLVAPEIRYNSHVTSLVGEVLPGTEIKFAVALILLVV